MLETERSLHSAVKRALETGDGRGRWSFSLRRKVSFGRPPGSAGSAVSRGDQRFGRRLPRRPPAVDRGSPARWRIWRTVPRGRMSRKPFVRWIPLPELLAACLVGENRQKGYRGSMKNSWGTWELWEFSILGEVPLEAVTRKGESRWPVLSGACGDSPAGTRLRRGVQFFQLV